MEHDPYEEIRRQMWQQHMSDHDRSAINNMIIKAQHDMSILNQETLELERKNRELAHITNISLDQLKLQFTFLAWWYLRTSQEFSADDLAAMKERYMAETGQPAPEDFNE
jgi:hypothetical protein